LQAIREFAELRSVTPVPCCPEHVVGQMNLRGDLITLMDIAKAMGLPAASARAGCKVVVLNNVELRAGVLVDEVLEVLYLPATDVTPVPASARASGQEYLRGTAPHGSRMLSLLDLPTLLMQESLIVNEEP
jgi:purine-binding chemotaxis protein CheW